VVAGGRLGELPGGEGEGVGEEGAPAPSPVRTQTAGESEFAEGGASAGPGGGAGGLGALSAGVGGGGAAGGYFGAAQVPVVVAIVGDWDVLWSPAFSSYYYFNRVTGECTWSPPPGHEQ
jgi:hypothetical protein